MGHASGSFHAVRAAVNGPSSRVYVLSGVLFAVGALLVGAFVVGSSDNIPAQALNPDAGQQDGESVWLLVTGLTLLALAVLAALSLGYVERRSRRSDDCPS